MQVLEYLDKKGVLYRLCSHHPAFTAQHMAAYEHVPGMDVAKAVLIKADGRPYLCVIPACCKVDLEAVAVTVGAEEVTVASEDELEKLCQTCADCEVGAEPPFGDMFGLETIMDDSLGPDGYVLCPAGTHELAVRMSVQDYQNLSHPRLARICYHLH